MINGHCTHEHLSHLLAVQRMIGFQGSVYEILPRVSFEGISNFKLAQIPDNFEEHYVQGRTPGLICLALSTGFGISIICFVWLWEYERVTRSSKSRCSQNYAKHSKPIFTTS